MANPPWDEDDFRIIIGTSKIDYDESKETINREKHGYSLLSAVDLLISRLLPFFTRPFISRDAFTETERRHEHMTTDDSGKVVFFVTTMRKNETIRVISLRRANDNEREVFAYFTGFREIP